MREHLHKVARGNGALPFAIGERLGSVEEIGVVSTPPTRQVLALVILERIELINRIALR